MRRSILLSGGTGQLLFQDLGSGSFFTADIATNHTAPVTRTRAEQVYQHHVRKHVSTEFMKAAMGYHVVMTAKRGGIYA